MPTKHLLEKLNAHGKLPSPKGVALRIMRLMENDDATVQALSRLIEADPAMSGRLLKLANSAFVGASRPVASVREAVIMLGMRMVRNVAQGFSVIASARKGAAKHFNYDTFWSHSLATAVAAHALACDLKTMSPYEAFTLGVLAQVGKLGLASLFPETYCGPLDASAGPDRVNEEETKRYGIGHTELGAELLKDWGLPDMCVQAARYHEDPNQRDIAEGSRLQQITRLLHLSSYLASMCVSSEENRESMLPGLYVRARELGILADDLIALANQVVSGWQEWSVILEVKVPAGFSFTDLQERANHAARPAAPALSMLCLPEALRILLVGADMAERLRLEQQLSAAGHVVVSAGNGQEALAHVLDMSPQLVITECELPVMDGLAFCRSLRLSKIGRQVYVIALGTEKGEQGQLDAITAGADDYLVKPLTIETLAARLRAAQRVVQLQQEVYRDREEIHRYAAELETANSRLQQAAQTDSLTGLYNRRHLMEQLGQLWEESRQTNLPLGFLMADLDDFKRVNDTQGHDVGDLFLQETAAVLWGAARRTDVVCRFGGEEFAVLCPNTALAGAELFAERLRARIENHVVLTKGKSLRVTLSVGVACKHGGMNVADDLLRAADQALYAAKQAGRNCVYVSEVVSPKATATVRPAAAQAGVLRIVS